MMITATVIVELKNGVLDPQGVTIHNALADMGYPDIRGVRSGKIFKLEIDAPDRNSARMRLDEICKKLLANPVIESYRLEVEAAR